MKKILLLSAIFSSSFLNSYSQLMRITLPKDNGSLYMLGGLNRNWFAANDIRYTGDGYDFTLAQVKAADNWQPYQFSDWSAHTPQFSFRLGYIFPGQSFVGFEFGYDHVLYSAARNQKVHETGIINGEIIDQDTTMGTNDLDFRHANGSNIVTLNFVKGFMVADSKDDDHMVNILLKVGGGIVTPRTEVSMMGMHTISDNMVGGYVIDLGAAVQYIFLRHIMVEIDGRGCYLNYTSVPTVDGGRASHLALSFQCMAMIGYQFRL